MKVNRIFSIGLVVICSACAVLAQEYPTPTETQTPPPVSAEDSSVGGSHGGGSSASKVLAPVWSQDLLRNYALGKVRRGVRIMYSPSLDWDWEENRTRISADGLYAEEVLEKLFSTNFVYRLKNADDIVRGYVYLYDENGNCLFYGSCEYKGNAPVYSIWMQEIPVLDGVASADELILNQDRSTADRNALRVSDDGQLFFSPWKAGMTNIVLAVSFKDGTSANLNVADGNMTSSEESDEPSANYSIDSHFVVKTGEKGACTVKIIATYNKPSVFLTVNSEQWVVFDVQGMIQGAVTSFERPVSIAAVESGSGNSFVAPMWPEEPSQIKFSPGKYRITFEWTNFCKPSRIYTSDGKG